MRFNKFFLMTMMTMMMMLIGRSWRVQNYRRRQPFPTERLPAGRPWPQGQWRPRHRE